MDNNTLEQRLERIEQQLEDIKLILRNMQRSCQGMDNHISFIENVYEVMRAPLDFTISTIINPIRGIRSDTEQPLSLPDMHENI